MNAITPRRLAALSDAQIHELAQVLCDCVEGGASVGFMLPMSRAKAERFWRGVAASQARQEREVFVAEDGDGAIVGTVQVVWAQPENQPHRADVAKMLVHTVTGSDADRLYGRLGWRRCGEIPRYALWPDGAPCATTVFFKLLDS